MISNYFLSVGKILTVIPTNKCEQVNKKLTLRGIIFPNASEFPILTRRESAREIIVRVDVAQTDHFTETGQKVGVPDGTELVLKYFHLALLLSGRHVQNTELVRVVDRNSVEDFQGPLHSLQIIIRDSRV